MVSRHGLEGLDFKALSLDQSRGLEKWCTKNEITRALSEQDGEKAPGLDGFPMRFY